MLKDFIEQGVVFEKNSEIKRTQERGDWRVSHATFGFFSNAESKAGIPKIREETTLAIEKTTSIANARIEASSIWSKNQLQLMDDLRRTVPLYENSDSPSF